MSEPVGSKLASQPTPDRTADLQADERRSLQEAMPRKAVILAAGRGKRLRPFTDNAPKPLLRYQGQATLDYVLASLVHAGVEEVCLVTHYLADQIEAHVGNGDRWGIQVSYRDQSEPLGSGHALQSAADFLTEPTFVLASDYLLPLRFMSDLKSIYLGQRADFGVSLKQLPPEELHSRSSVRFDESGKILEIVEKPAPGTAPSQVGASLIFVVPPEIRHYLGRIELSARGEYELQRAINMMLADGYTVAGLMQEAPAEWELPSQS